MKLYFILVILFLFIIFLLLPMLILGESIIHIKTIFDRSPCNTFCFNRVHLLCFDNHNITCPGIYKTYYADQMSSANVQFRLSLGHNGLRNRIAIRMNVANMLKMSWSNELEEMAMNFFYYCKPYRDDVCSNQNLPLNYTEKYVHFSKGRDGYKFIVQNRFCVDSEFFPRNLIELVMRNWYYNKNDLRKPKTDSDDSLGKPIGIVYGKNNFTHLSYPLTSRFGCALARYDRSYCVTCFYYPYFMDTNTTYSYLRGDPGTSCPAYFPLKDEQFRGLCTGIYHSGIYGDVTLPKLWFYIGLVNLIFELL